MNTKIRITKEDIKKMVFKSLLEIRKRTHIHEVKYFHPSGKSLPNGSSYQKGGFLNECRINKNNFTLDESVHGEQYGLSNYRGGVIVFSVNVNAIQLSDNKFINKIKQFIETQKQRFGKDAIVHDTINSFNSEDNGEYIGAYSLGNFFKGKYVGDNGEMFNDRSICIEINGLSSKALLNLGEKIANKFHQETVLIKDLNKNKIYLADGMPSNSNIEDDLENINTKC